MKKRRFNLIVGKKQIALACLTCLLGVAVYVNYITAQSPNGPISTVTETKEGTNYGEAEFVAGRVTSGDETSEEYFSKARLEKKQSRDEAVETLQACLAAKESTPEELETVSAEAAQYSALIESENQVETTVKALGFEDCLVYLDGASANILVKTEGLDPTQAAQIKSALLNAVTVPAENITIVEVK